MQDLPVKLCDLPLSDSLPPQCRDRLQKIEDSIDISSADCALSYGADAQKQLVQLSEQVLSKVKNKELGEIGEWLSRLNAGLGSIDGGDRRERKNPRKTVALLKARCEKAEKTVDKTALKLQNTLHGLLCDIELMELMIEQTRHTLQELALYITAGMSKLQKEQKNHLTPTEHGTVHTGGVQEWAGYCDRFEKRLLDLHLTYTVCMQSVPQLRLVQSSDTLMAQKLQSALTNTIPLWKSQMVIALSTEHTLQAENMAQDLSCLTGRLLVQNSLRLKQTVLTAQQRSDSPGVDISALQEVNKNLIDTITEVDTLRQQGASARRTLFAELAQLCRNPL